MGQANSCSRLLEKAISNKNIKTQDQKEMHLPRKYCSEEDQAEDQINFNAVSFNSFKIFFDKKSLEKNISKDHCRFFYTKHCKVNINTDEVMNAIHDF